MGLLRWVPLIYTAVFTIAFVFIGLKSALVDLEPNNCKMTYMWPQYVPVKGMKHPKYDLYFYREGETKVSGRIQFFFSINLSAHNLHVISIIIE
jgi:hypothetical protein